MTIDRSRRVTFDELAELYDETCFTYPQEMIDDILDLSGIPAGGRILEIGCGPGNSTLPFARRDYRILGIELGERLAARAAAACRPYPGVEIRNIAFEEWEIEERAFDLAFSADAFHWIPPEIGYPKVARALKDSGSAALAWNPPVDPRSDWSSAIDQVYRTTAPDVENPDTLYSSEWLAGIVTGNLQASGCFGPVTVRQYDRSATYTSAGYLKRLRTFSGHRGLDGDTRDKLFAGIREVIERFGGQVTKTERVVLFHARVKR